MKTDELGRKLLYPLENEELVKFMDIFCKPSRQYEDLINLTSSINSSIKKMYGNECNYSTDDVLEACRRLSYSFKNIKGKMLNTREYYGRVQIKVDLNHRVLVPIITTIMNWPTKKNFIERTGEW